jgi:hypothetical protein
MILESKHVDALMELVDREIDRICRDTRGPDALFEALLTPEDREFLASLERRFNTDWKPE